VSARILNYFASGVHGQISRLTYAKSLFTAPMAVLGQAAGAASLPFFASLFNQGRLADFAAAVNGSVSRILIFSLLLSAWMPIDRPWFGQNSPAPTFSSATTSKQALDYPWLSALLGLAL
jgi:hypothetical protein